MKHILIFILFISQNISYSQLEIKGKITDDSTGSALSGCIISLKEFDGNLIESVSTSSNGKYKFNRVQTGKNYKIFFSKENFISKYCVIEPENMNPKDSTVFPVEISLSLFKGDIADYSFLQFAPVAIAKYDQSTDNLIWDMEYILKMKELMDKIKNKK